MSRYTLVALTSLWWAINNNSSEAFTSPITFVPKTNTNVPNSNIFKDLGNLFYAAGAKDSEEDDVVLFDDGERVQQGVNKRPVGGTRWDRLDPEIRERIRKEGQARAVANKKKREPASLKRSRMMMYMKQQQRKRKLEARVERPVPTKSPERIPLENLQPGSKVANNGTVISITAFGAYVDVGTEGCDGLLHISQLRHLDFFEDAFVERVSDVLQPGDSIEQPLYVTQVSPTLNKLQLSLLSGDSVVEDKDDESDLDKITIEELEVDDELWGEITRVTRFGAYVEVGAVVEGWLHFMDHPDWGIVGWGDSDVDMQTPSDMMAVGERVRVWVSNLDHDRRRIKLTGNRPLNLPQIRREVVRQ